MSPTRARFGAAGYMTTHAWLAPSAALAAKVRRARARAVLRALATLPPAQFGARAAAWRPLFAALPALLRVDAGRVLDAVARVDVLSALGDLADGSSDAGRLERAMVTLWLGIAGHPGLVAPLALPGPFRERVVDPRAARLLALGEVRGLAATAQGPMVIAGGGSRPIDELTVAALPAAGTTVIVDERLAAPGPEVVARVCTALAAVGALLPGGGLERVTVGVGEAVDGEARVGPDADPADLLASAQAAFVRAAATLDAVLSPLGVLAEKGRRLSPVDVLARACGNAVALPWRADRPAAMATIVDDLDDLAVVAEPTPTGVALIAALRALASGSPTPRRRALVVNVDNDDFVYSFQFGQSVERRCVDRDLRVDRIATKTGVKRDLAAELGMPVPAPIADGTEILVDSEDDPSLADALARLSTRRYEVAVANARPKLFYDLLAAGLLAVPTRVWDRHLHNGLAEEQARRGYRADAVRALPIRVWSLLGGSGPELHTALVDAGLDRGAGYPWAMDLEFFRSTAPRHPDRLFAGGDSGRDWPLFIEAIRDLPLDVHLVTARAAAELPARVHVDTRLTLWQFRDAMAAASMTAIPLLASAGASGVTVLPMAMALGVAVVATRTPWVVQYVTDGEEALLVPAGDVGAFRDALVRLHRDADLRARLVANARRRVAALCDLDAFTRAMFATLD